MSNLIPEGYYDAVAIETGNDAGERGFAHLGAAKNGTRQVGAYFRLLSGTYAGRTISWFGSFTAKSYERTCESLRIMGWKGDDLLAIEQQELNQLVSVKVEVDEYQGKARNRVAFVNAPGGGVVKMGGKMTLDDKRKFAASMRARLGDIPEVEGQRVTAEEVEAAAPPEAAAAPNGAHDGGSEWGVSPPGPNEDPFASGPPPGDDDIPF